MRYLIILNSHEAHIPKLSDEHLEKFQSGLKAALDKGSIEGAYAKVGGGLVFITNWSGHGDLTVELRKHHIMDAEVIPLVPLASLLEAHSDYRKTGTAKA
ncbi:MAG: hypothetical protein JNN15_13180 [Blastocatellia bacterium]|nr:hypothetical protein [Blastocatellia bacterium]